MQNPSEQDNLSSSDTAAPYQTSAVERARQALGELKTSPSMVPDATEGAIIAGRYKLLQRIGEGGMGEVWMAGRREDFKQMVAIKLIKAGMDTRQVLARFEAERQALAIMDHPNIARVFDGGSTERGHPFFVMELVRGLPLTQYCDQRKMSVRQRIELFSQVCSAIQHAHQKGIIHRDLKPSNILVTENDGTPVPKVIDFGLAKALTGGVLTEKTVFTAFGAAAGTPLYMAPEQAAINAIDIDTRADIYALGVILYELLTGTTPLSSDQVKRAAWEEVCRVIRDQDPQRPSLRVSTNGDLPSLAATRQTEPAQLPGQIRGELDWIVMKALDKDRKRRYETANDLAADLKRHLNGEPILAAPPTIRYRASKFISRHKTALVVASAFFALLLAAVIGTSSGWLRARVALASAEISRQQAETSSALASQQADIALHAKADADQQARLARKAALLAEARYLIQISELGNAVTKLKDAEAQSPLTYDERLALNELFKASRSGWTLKASIPMRSRPTAANFVTSVAQGQYVVGILGPQLFMQDIENSSTAQCLDLDVRPTNIIPLRGPSDCFLVVAGNRLLSCAIQPLRIAQSRQFSANIIAHYASPKSVIILTADGSIQLLDPQTLQPRESWDWKNLQNLPKQTLDAGLPRVCAISPDDRFVILHSGAWNVPTIVIDRTAGKTFNCQMRIGIVSFDPTHPDVCMTWYSPSRNGGLTDLLTSYDLTKEAALISDVGTPNDDSKEPIYFAPADSATWILFGSVGTVEHHEFYGERKFRYGGMWPVPGDEPEFLSCNLDASMLALASKDKLLVFERNENSAISAHIMDWCTCSTPKGAYFREWSGKLRYEPFSLTEHGSAIEPVMPSLPGILNWFPWALHVTPDAAHGAILMQDSLTGKNSVTDTYGPRKVYLYDIKGNATDSWKLTKTIDLPDATDTSAFSNRLVRLSPDGKSVLVGYIDGHTCRLDCGSGQVRDQWAFDRTYQTSSDGSYVAGRIPPSPDVIVFRISDGTPVARLKDVKNFMGGCFSDDGSAFVLSDASRQLKAFDLTSGNLLWQVKSHLVPRAWCVARERFLGMARESSGTSSRLMLADVKTGQPLAMITPFVEYRNDQAFAADGSVIYSQADRWDVNFTRVFSTEQLGQALSTPEVAVKVTPSLNSPLPGATPLEDSALNGAISADNTSALTAQLSHEVTVVGDVEEVQPTLSGGHYNVLLGPPDKGLLLFIRSANLRQFRDMTGGDLAAGLTGRRVAVRGELTKYGGRKAEWLDRMQIELTDSSQLRILGDSATTQP